MPKTVAVMRERRRRRGASRTHFIRRIRDSAIRPIYPSIQCGLEIEACRLSKTSAHAKPIDYAYIAIPAAQIPPIYRQPQGVYALHK